MACQKEVQVTHIPILLLLGRPPELPPSTAQQPMAMDFANDLDTPAVTAAPEIVTKPQESATSMPGETEVAVDAAGANPEGGFGGLSNEFLKAMQDALEDLGWDLGSADIMEQLGDDEGLADQLLNRLLQSARATGVKDPAVLREMVRQWQQAIQEQLEEEKRLAQKKQRPIWRCAVCGRYGCPVAPYMESYADVDE